MTNGKIIFISPHLDDVILSCGEFVAKLRNTKREVLVITIFSGTPMSENISHAAKLFHDSCNLGDNAMHFRKNEDEKAMKLLDVEYIHIGELESLYRKNTDGTYKYNEIEHIFTTDTSNEIDTIKCLSSKIENIFANMNIDKIYIPLGIGNHIDHVITRKSIENIASKFFFKKYYYEDTPYVCNLESNNYSELTSELNSFVIKVTDEEWNLKCEAINCYVSQLDMLWKNEEEKLMQLNLLSFQYLKGYRSIRFYCTD